MKKLLIIVLFASCGVEPAKIECGDKPFVVGSIESYGQNYSMYTAEKFAPTMGSLFSGKASFIAKNGLYNIGDTVKLTK